MPSPPSPLLKRDKPLATPIPSWGTLVSWDVTAMHAKTGNFAGLQKSEVVSILRPSERTEANGEFFM
jgi:hypothetical protein